MTSKHEGRPDRGAAALEMALVLPLLLLLVFGIIDFGRIFTAEIQLSQAAREGVRLQALQLTGFEARAKAAAPMVRDSMAVTPGGVACTSSSNPTAVTTVTATWTAQGLIIGSFIPGIPTTYSQTAEMRCGG